MSSEFTKAVNSLAQDSLRESSNVPAWVSNRRQAVEFLRTVGFSSSAMSMMTDEEIERAVELEKQGKSGLDVFHTGVHSRQGGSR